MQSRRIDTTTIEDFIEITKHNKAALDKLKPYFLRQGYIITPSRISKLRKNELVVQHKLLDFQIPHTNQIINTLRKHKQVLDFSDTGTGKTYTTLAAIRELNKKCFVVCPKSIKYKWKELAEEFGVDLIAVTYEKLSRGNTEYISKIDKKFFWHISEDFVIVYDEVHRCKNFKSLNSKILVQAKVQKYDIIMLSATAASTPLNMFAIGVCLEFYDNNWYKFMQWCKSYGVVERYVKKGVKVPVFTGQTKNMQKIHALIFPEHGSRMKISELGDRFPKNIISVELCEMKDWQRIRRIYDKIDKLVSRIDVVKHKIKDDFNKLVLERQKIEYLKIPTIVEFVNDLLDTGKSVVVFVNWRNTIDELSKLLGTTCIVDGERVKERVENIEKFQRNEENIILCNLAAGSASISLHDLEGTHPRASIICPDWSAQNLIQALGRIHRAGAKSPALQKIIYCEGTIEERICKNVRRKVQNIQLLNDGDLGMIL